MLSNYSYLFILSTILSIYLFILSYYHKSVSLLILQEVYIKMASKLTKIVSSFKSNRDTRETF